MLLDDCILVWRARPGADDDALDADILAWGENATKKLARGAGMGPALFVPVRSDDLRVAALLAGTGFRRDEWRTLRIERSLQGPLAPPQVPTGVVLGPLMGEADLAAALALDGFALMMGLDLAFG